MKIHHSRKNGGFTLVETLVAISILIVAITGPLSTAAQSLINSRHANDQISAYYLAQEGIEVVRGIRDNNSFAGNAWLTGISADCFDSAKRCVADALAPDPASALISCGTSPCPALQYADTGTGGVDRIFRQGQIGSAWKNSIYTRDVTLSYPTAGVTTEVLVRARITWVNAGNTRTFTLSENIFDWK